MKIALITDIHFGARNDSVIFLDHYDNFFKNTFFPKLEEEGIDTIIILGDTFDRRKYVNFHTLQRAKEIFFDKLVERGIKAYVLVGNHDTYFKNTNEVNSVSLLLGEYPNLEIIPEPTTINIQGTDFCMIPWICSGNYERFQAELKNTKAEICCGHLEIAGFAMYKGAVLDDGLPRETFAKFDLTFSGHYHYRSSDGSMFYLGNPFQLTWQDFGDQRGFHLFDLSTRNLEFIPNTTDMFIRLTYDDKESTVNEIVGHDMSSYTGKYIKVVVLNKTNPYLFDMFMNNLYQTNPSDVTVVEDFTELTEGVEDAMVDQAQDTITTLNTYIDSIKDTNIDTNRLKSIVKELYVEALNQEQA